MRRPRITAAILNKMKKKIILIESNKDLVDIYRHVFKKTDFDVEHASRADQMLEELRDMRNGTTNKPDLVILDLMLDEGDGLEILKAMKKSYLTKDIPVFAFTNYQNHDLDRHIKNLGIAPEKYLIKAHHTPKELIGIIDHYFENNKRGGMTTLS
jgi:DNA-binding response OmpR family regulator